jgi:predicted RNase H-like HicB family nuclease
MDLTSNIRTQGETMEKLLANVHEAVEARLLADRPAR